MIRSWLAIITLLCGAIAAPVCTLAQHPIEVQRKASSGDYLEALALYDRLPRRQITTSATVAAAKSAWALSLPERAVAEFDQALQDKQLGKGERARLLLSRGIIEYQEGHFQVAILYAEKSLKQLKTASPLQAKAWLLWGESLSQLKSYGAAEEKYQKALEASLPAERPEVHYLLGVCQMKLGRLVQARQNFERVPLQHARTADALRGLAELSLQQGQSAQAVFWLNKGRQDYPDKFLDCWVDYILVRAAVEMKDAKQVKLLQAEAQKKYPPSDYWLTLLNAAAEAFNWQMSKGAGSS
ncbi:MAG: tetratricopeptide repeat protein [Deltaproteobacteria bacterium]|nr:tetratricopeptide repeat protein [Deltaproteobacteria bacterium]